MERKNWAERFADQVRSFPGLVLLLLLSGIIAATGTVFGAATCAWDEYQDRFHWREQEYQKIDELAAGLSIEQFIDVLGPPRFNRESNDGWLKERTFEGRDFWVQAIHDATGAVLLFSVTACDDDFRPTIEGPKVDGVTLIRVKLNDTLLKDVPATPSSIRYSVAVATGNNVLYDEYYFGNPGLYKEYYVGINDACATRALDLQPLFDRMSFFQPTPRDYGVADTVAEDPDSAAIEAFRRSSVANTYAESFLTTNRGRVVTIDEILAEFQIGVDRLHIRTAD